jgi:hypothetical protein
LLLLRLTVRVPTTTCGVRVCVCAVEDGRVRHSIDSERVWRSIDPARAPKVTGLG